LHAYLSSPHPSLLCFMTPLLLRSTLFPYTTLFRSQALRMGKRGRQSKYASSNHLLHRFAVGIGLVSGHSQQLGPLAERTDEYDRSEEHTSELQSRENLVCRLLLEKKKTNSHESMTT